MVIRYKSIYIFVLTLICLVFLGLISILRLPGSESSQPLNREKEEISVPEPEYNTEREISSESLSEWVSRFDEIGPISSILISQHGELVTEEYFGSMHANRAHNIKSASKSILSVLTGIAIEQDYLEGVDQEIGGFFPEYFKENPDSVKASITIGDLLTMRSGLASTSRANYGRWVTSSHWVHYALDRPLTGKPGFDRTYSTGNTHLLAVILARASGMNTLDFANRYLFDPMDIRIRGWDRDPQGNYLGGNNMAIIPRDMIKLGQLMMNMGVYNGKQLVSGEWISRSIEPVTGRRTGINNYGFLWFRRMSGNFHVVYAFGNGGQYIMILPELEAVISVTTRNNTSESTRNYRRELFRQLDREVIPRLAASFSPA